jgi:hypothetical protein
LVSQESIAAVHTRKHTSRRGQIETPGQQLSPKEFLKGRRPEYFSDSVGHDSPVLDRSLLEYQLDTLTSRSEESQFETFARRLLEHTVCPNLLSHTGPTGGGDSKVDTETYPVAETLAMSWYMGTGDRAATERWAFAFSAKKDWRPKLKSDIAKIVATGRGYTKAFFVSNQYIRDKERAETEDQLQTQYGMEVRVFDRTWLLDKVFGGRLEQLAIDELGLKTSVRREVRKGPLDTQREQDLEIVEARITAAHQDGRHSLALVDDYLEAANLARGLERPRTEVEGLYVRADRLAKRFGTPHQQVESTYAHAWTAFWWYEDYQLFLGLYAELEERARGSRNAYDLELWTNLFFALRTAVSRGELKADKVDLSRRSAGLLAELDRLTREQERPSTALQGRTLQLLVRLLFARQDTVDPILRELASVVRKSEGLVGYPFAPLAQILTEFGTILGTRPAYEEVFDTVLQTAVRRNGEVAAARMLLTRGAQQLDADLPYEAIRTIGRALGRLYKHESRADAVLALYLCARAYEQVGLLWAARGTMLSAASIATNVFWTHNKATPQQSVCYNRLKWIELRLGRLPHLLAWHDLDRVVRAALAEQGYSMERLSKNDQYFDPILGILLLGTDLWDLQDLVRLPDVLDGLDLPSAAVALRYALGHEDEVPPELVGELVSSDAKRDLFRQWRDQPATKEIPPQPLLYTRRTVTLSSNVLGCHITVDCWNQSPYVELAESALAAIESFLATGVLERMVAREPTLTISIRPSDFAAAPFTYETRDHDGRPHIEIRCRSFEPHTLSGEEQDRLKEQLFALVAHIIARAFAMSEPELLLTKLFRDELAPQRALDFTTSFVAVGNVLGHQPKTTLASWTCDNAKAYPLIREKVWDNEDRERTTESERGKRPTLADPGAELAAKLADPNSAAHNQMRTISLIREALWNEASWFGTAFAPHPDNGSLPVLALLFRHRTPAEKILALWRSELGPRDEENKLRVAIIRGVSKTNPHMYRVVVGSNPAASFSHPDTTRAVMIARIHTMEPSSSENLKRFLDSYEVCKSYILTLGFRVGQHIDLAPKNQLLKQELVVREAWEIGLNDIDVVAIREDDDPVVPDGQECAPVLEALKRCYPGR